MGFNWDTLVPEDSRSILALDVTGTHDSLDFSARPLTGSVGGREVSSSTAGLVCTGPHPHATVPRKNFDKELETALVEYMA